MTFTGRRILLGILLLIVASCVGLVPSVRAQASNTNVATESGRTASGQAFDVKAAVDAYLATIPAEKRARSDAYFEGGYWLQLWDFLSIVVVMWILLRFRWSAWMRDVAERITRFKALQTSLYWVQFALVVAVLIFPLTVYEGFFREHKYGLSNQSFGQWMRDQVVGLAVTLVLGAILLVVLFGLVRRLGKNWWVWGSVVSLIFTAFVVLIAPVFISPLFNTYTKLADPRIREPILSLARANGIPATERISLNDNLLKRCSLAGIASTMGHEMGHYVLNHVFKGLVLNGVVMVLTFALLNWGLNAALARWGESWGIRGITDLAVLPLAVLLVSTISFLLTPVDNTMTRTMEYEADLYGINASQQPDGEAEVDLMLGEYRKLDPGPIEEFLFFDHPSGRTRITAAMRWKAEHLAGAPLGPESGARP